MVSIRVTVHRVYYCFRWLYYSLESTPNELGNGKEHTPETHGMPAGFGFGRWTLLGTLRRSCETRLGAQDLHLTHDTKPVSAVHPIRRRLWLSFVTCTVRNCPDDLRQ